MSSHSGPTTLLDLLRNPLILSHTVPYLPTTSILLLASTSRCFHSLLLTTYPEYTFRRLDLSSLPSPLLRAQISRAAADVDGALYRHTTQDMESVDDYYAAPLRRAFYVLKKKAVLEYVTTLILDGLTVPAALVREILCDKPFNVRILSLRGVENLGDEKLIQILRYLIRPSRPAGSPKLKGLYYFTVAESWASILMYSYDQSTSLQQPDGVTTTAGSHLGHRSSSTRTLPKWSNGLGNLFRSDPSTNEAWVQLIEACQGVIAFDTIACQHGSHLPPRLATIALRAEGCQRCHSAPEQPLVFGQTPAHKLPLLPPPPLFSSTVKAAQCLASGENSTFYARCTECMKDRMCENCNAWWCEDCYTPPSKPIHGSAAGSGRDIKVHMGLCVSKCLVEELYTGAGEGGMWG